jgi:hypothetical protein
MTVIASGVEAIVRLMMTETRGHMPTGESVPTERMLLIRTGSQRRAAAHLPRQAADPLYA